MKLLKKSLLILAALVASINAQASVYQVNGLKLEFKRFNSQKIRSYAVDVATKRGFEKLLKSIVPAQYNVKEIIESVDLKKTEVVEKLNIVKEVNKKGLYQAEIDILYSAEKIKKILQAKRIPYTQETMGKVLLLPIEKSLETGKLVLFEDSNKLKDELVKSLSNSLLIEPVIAKGDLKEITTYNPQNVLDDNNKDNVLELATKYEANKAIVILLEKNNFDGNDMYQTTIKYINFDNMQDESTVIMAPNVEQAAKNIALKIKNTWQTNNLLEFNKPKRFIAMINTNNSLDELYETINHMKTLRIVSDVNIKQLTTTAAFVQTDFYGTPQEFLNKAKQKRLNIFQAENGQWIIERVLD